MGIERPLATGRSFIFFTQVVVVKDKELYYHEV